MESTDARKSEVDIEREKESFSLPPLLQHTRYSGVLSPLFPSGKGQKRNLIHGDVHRGDGGLRIEASEECEGRGNHPARGDDDHAGTSRRQQSLREAHRRVAPLCIPLSPPSVFHSALIAKKKSRVGSSRLHIARALYRTRTGVS